MEHYITKIEIEKMRHLSNIDIMLNVGKRQHLLITGKNGSGKTTLLLRLQKYLSAINDRKLNLLKHDYMAWINSVEKALENVIDEQECYKKAKEYEGNIGLIKKYSDGVQVHFKGECDLDTLYEQGNFVIAYFSAERKTKIIRANGVQDIRLKQFYRLEDEPGSVFVKYMVHLKTQQAYARNESDDETVVRIEKWFERLESALRVLFDDKTLQLKYNYKEYDFKIIEKGREPFSFDELSDGYSSVIHILSDLILRMDKNWILENKLSEYDIEGIVLIDELETHLHIELQKKILPFLTTFFPRIQFVVTTHSPYILNSISNAKAYDLEKQVELENLLSYSSEDLAEGYFDSDEYAEELKIKLERYRELVEKSTEDLLEEERLERASLRMELKQISDKLFGEIKDVFEEIELQRKKYG